MLKLVVNFEMFTYCKKVLSALCNTILFFLIIFFGRGGIICSHIYNVLGVDCNNLNSS